jgi:hypothetical protein
LPIDPGRVGARTVVMATPAALASAELAPLPAPGPQARPPAARVGAATQLGVAVPAGVVLATAPAAAPPSARVGAATQLGVAVPAGVVLAAAAASATPRQAPGPSSAAPAGVPARNRTMMGVAMPGIAPTHDVYSPAGDELGATLAPSPDVAHWQPGPSRRGEPIVDVRAPRPRPPKPRPVAARGFRRSTLVMIVAGGLAVFAVAFGVFWRSAAALSVRAKVNADGHEVLHVQCSSCPDGTELRLRGGVARVAAGQAELALATPLVVGKNELAITVDRPGGGRDETVQAAVDVAYRIRPDLATLDGERPAIQIVVQATPGARIALDGQAVTMTGGQAIHSIDVAATCTGPSSEAATLRRTVQYTVTPAAGPAESGTLDVSVGIVPLQIDAPGPHVVTDDSSFMLAGRTLPGADVLVAGRPITVRPDGSFAQTLSVSTVGSTQIYVRAQKKGMAPRLAPIAVKRVASLAAEATEFKKQPLAELASVVSDTAAHVGKPVVVPGSVLDARVNNHQTVALVDVARASGCKPTAGTTDGCRVRLVYGADSSPIKRGDSITAYGTVARAFVPAGAPDSARIAEVQVDFVQRGAP